jgi:hypothetical protein
MFCPDLKNTELVLKVDLVDLPSLTSSGIYPGPYFSYWKLTKVLAKFGLALNLVGAIN